MKSAFAFVPLAGVVLLSCTGSAKSPAAGLVRSDLGAAYETVDPEGPAAPGTSAFVEPTGEIALRDAVAAALLGSPALAAFAWEVRRRDAQIVQAGLLPNPQVQLEVENVGGSGDRAAFEQTETTLWLTQLVPIGGKPSKRRRVAELDRDLSAWEWESARLGVLTETTKAFVATLEAQRRVGLVRELERVAAESVRALESMVAAGGASPVERNRIDVELSSARLRRQDAEADLAVRRAALAATWGSASPRFSRVTGHLAHIVEPPPFAALDARLADNPDFARWATELERQTAALSLEEARALPDPTVSVGGRHFRDNGDGAVVFSFTVPLPVFDQNQGNVLAATRGISKAKAERASAEANVRSTLRARYEELALSYRAARLLDRETLPAAERTWAGARDAHRAGVLRSLDVLEAQRTLFELRARYLTALASYHLARADVERLTATPLDSIGGAP